AAHLREPARPPSGWAVGLPATVDALLLRCLEKAPEHRFQSMTDLQAACEAQLAKITGANAMTIAVAAPLAVSPPTTFSRAAGEAIAPPRRRSIAWLATGGVVVAGLAVFALTRPARGTDDARPAAAAPPPPAPAAARAPIAIDAGVADAPPAAVDAPPPPADAPAAQPIHRPPSRRPNRPAPPPHPTSGDPYDVR
ncbi:MAG: hypothetical protein ACM31C_11160, partial [Acidobacteriota bacterium]